MRRRVLDGALPPSPHREISEMKEIVWPQRIVRDEGDCMVEEDWRLFGATSWNPTKVGS